MQKGRPCYLNAAETIFGRRDDTEDRTIPCVVRAGWIAEEDSLAEKVKRAPLHPLDQFRGFPGVAREGPVRGGDRRGLFVAVSVVKQRLHLASVSPKLLDEYAEDGVTVDQLMTFTVNGGHERQEQFSSAICLRKQWKHNNVLGVRRFADLLDPSVCLDGAYSRGCRP